MRTPGIPGLLGGGAPLAKGGCARSNIRLNAAHPTTIGKGHSNQHHHISTPWRPPESQVVLLNQNNTSNQYLTDLANLSVSPPNHKLHYNPYARRVLSYLILITLVTPLCRFQNSICLLSIIIPRNQAGDVNNAALCYVEFALF